MPMRKFIVVVLLCLLPASLSFAHPGKTDRQGGHKCIKDCEEWKLYYMEYHLHDKFGRPIRVEKHPRKRAAAPAIASLVTPTVAPQVVTETTRTVTVYRTVVQEENLLPSNPLLYLLLLLLLLLLVLRMNRKREE